jgi:sugar phosphate isomerase/epimerase
MADTGVAVARHRVPALRARPAVGVPEGFLEVSARLGARHVLVMSAEPAEVRTLERFGELCDRAATYGLQVGLEFAVYTGVTTLGHAAEMIARSKRTNASILIDALHFSRSGGLPAHVAQVDPELLRYAQICDAGPDMPRPDDTPSLIREARTGRLLPGDGVLPLRELVAALPPGCRWPSKPRIGTTAHLPALERAKRAHRALTALLAPA